MHGRKLVSGCIFQRETEASSPEGPLRGKLDDSAAIQRAWENLDRSEPDVEDLFVVINKSEDHTP